jgi:hypothetical protein
MGTVLKISLKIISFHKSDFSIFRSSRNEQFSGIFVIFFSHNVHVHTVCAVNISTDFFLHFIVLERRQLKRMGHKPAIAGH